MSVKTGPICFIIVLFVFLTIFSGQAKAAGDMDNSIYEYENMLGKYVSDGAVDYLKWKKNDLGAFEQYINSFAGMSLANLNENERKAFWINTYNALTIYAVLKHIQSNGLLARVFSVQMVRGFFDKITYRVSGETLTLNDIENEKLRKSFHDPRVHFVLVCASRSCPKMQNAAFKGIELDERLDNAARNFIQDTSRNRLDQKNNVLYLSEIFKWYEADFTASEATVIHFVKKYMGKEGREYLSINTVRIRYIFYDWLVNIKR